VLVALGDRQWDVTHRALVLGVVDGPDAIGQAVRHVAEGTDLLALAGDLDISATVPVVRLDGPELAELGDLVVPAPDEGADRERVLAVQSLAITRGARVVLTRDVRGTRRVADVLAAILART
jgi:hypothetical protein